MCPVETKISRLKSGACMLRGDLVGKMHDLVDKLHDPVLYVFSTMGFWVWLFL